MSLIKIIIIFCTLISVIKSEIMAGTGIENYLQAVDILHVDSGIALVDCVYIINLENRPQKWIKARDAFNFYKIYPNRVNAINGWALSQKDKKKLCGNYPLRLRGGQMGCILSHLSALCDAFERKYDFIWICEDDIQIYENPHKISHLMALLSEIDPKWDVLYTDKDSKNNLGETVYSLGSDFRPDFPHQKNSYYIKRKSIGDQFIKIRQRFGAYSMIISKVGIEKILLHFTKNYLWTAYDIDIHYIPGIKQYCLNQDLVSLNYKELSDTESENN